ncbi:MAG TPA: hypothetical protein VHP35_10915 [Terriglobia bacterium]|nr:hypothetical protein [Terriglobia bacterium]
MTDIGLPVAQDINHRGQISGYFLDARNFPHAYLWEKSKLIDLTSTGDIGIGTGLNDGGQVVGWSAPNGLPNHASLWDRNGQQDLGTLGGADSIAVAINRQGQIAGHSSTVGQAATHAFLWENGVLTDLGALGGGYSLARGIDDRGRIIGLSNTASGESHAFIWEAGVMTDLNTLLPANSGWTLQEAAGINQHGLIVGVGINPDGQLRPYLLQP